MFADEPVADQAQSMGFITAPNSPQRKTHKMPLTARSEDEKQSAELVTIGFVIDAVIDAGDDPERVMVIGNSMIAAARILFDNHNIDRNQQAALYREFWSPLVKSGGMS
ncbi:hypothetical protein [Methylobacterium currus]|uniref:hypothetical protein n=1 Tax=Methylobacterium currus TaxID=2051553 RepID=UPI000F4F7E6E|nr:hypothetical protein [Methylobacterium currus]